MQCHSSYGEDASVEQPAIDIFKEIELGYDKRLPEELATDGLRERWEEVREMK
ncbi:MAG: hypothetical protein U5K71_14750 [Gracilimonas sp.]|nr:hypothetical protein [Gracilimonas sp.]